MQLKGRLVACVECPDAAQEDSVDWREFLGTTLPSYMIPAQAAVLAKMPISSAGKVDRKALLENADSYFNRNRTTEEEAAPQGPLEQQIAAIWEDVIGVQPIFREDNFSQSVEPALWRSLSANACWCLAILFPCKWLRHRRTIAELARRITALEEQSTIDAHHSSYEYCDNRSRELLDRFEIGLAPAASHIIRVLSVHGNCPAKEVWQAAWTRLIDRHPALRTGFYAHATRAIHWRTFTSDQLSRRSTFHSIIVPQWKRLGRL